MTAGAMAPAGVGAAAFRAAMACLPAPITVVTCFDDDGAARGLTVSAVSSVSLDPPLLLICLDRKSATHDVLLGVEQFCVNILGPGQEHLAQRFAGPSQHRYCNVRLRPGATPVLADATVSVTCVPHRVHAGGDHSIVVGRIVEISGPGLGRSNAEALVWHQRGFARTRQS